MFGAVRESVRSFGCFFWGRSIVLLLFVAVLTVSHVAEPLDGFWKV